MKKLIFTLFIAFFASSLAVNAQNSGKVPDKKENVSTKSLQQINSEKVKQVQNFTPNVHYNGTAAVKGELNQVSLPQDKVVYVNGNEIKVVSREEIEEIKATYKKKYVRPLTKQQYKEQLKDKNSDQIKEQNSKKIDDFDKKNSEQRKTFRALLTNPKP